MSGGSSGSSQPTTTTVNQTSIPAYAQPYVESTLGQAQALTSQSQYQPYSSSNLFAPFTPLQNQAMGNISNMQVSPQIQQGTDLANQAGSMAGQYGNMGAQSGATGQNLGTQGGAAFGNMGAQAGASYGQNATDPNAVASYMNPYIQNTLQPAQQLLNQQYGMQGAAEQSAATSQGAFGGSREALMAGLNQQNANLASNQLVGNAYNQAYNTANTNMQNAAQLGISGANAGLQGVNTQLAGTAQGMQGAQAGISGTNAQLQAAGTLGQLGQTNYSQQMGIDQAQLGAGAQQQQQQQNVNNFNYQQSLNEQNFPYQNLSFMQGMYSGLPMSQSSQQMYQAQPSIVPQAVGAAGAYMTSNAMKPGGKTGGLGSKIAGYAGGGIVALAGGGDTSQNATGVPSGSAISQLNPLTLPSALASLSTEQVQGYARSVPPGTVAAELVNTELQKRTSTQQSVASIPAINGAQRTAAQMSPNELPQQAGLAGQRGLPGKAGISAYGKQADFQVPTGAQGGIVAFGGGGNTGNTPDKNFLNPIQSYDMNGEPINPYLTPNEQNLLVLQTAKEQEKAAGMPQNPYEGPVQSEETLKYSAAGQGADPTSLSSNGSSFPTSMPPAAPPPSPNYAGDVNASMANPMEAGASGAAPTPSLSPAANVANAKAAPITGAMPTGATTAAGDKISFGKAAPSPAGLGSFADFKSRIADEAKLSPEDQAQLNKQRQNNEAKVARAANQESNVVNQSLMQGFLAMMGGRTMAEGVAKAAEKFGNTYATADQAAKAATEKAAEAQDAQSQYEMALKRGDKKLAADMVEKYDKISIDKYKADLDYSAKTAATSAAGAANIIAKQQTLLGGLTNALTNANAKRDAAIKNELTPMQKSFDAQYLMVPDKEKPAFTEAYNKAVKLKRLEIEKTYDKITDPIERDLSYYRGNLTGRGNGSSDSTSKITLLGPKP